MIIRYAAAPFRIVGKPSLMGLCRKGTAGFPPRVNGA